MTRKHFARILIFCACTAAALGSAGCERSQPGPKPISSQGQTAADGVSAGSAAGNPAPSR